MNRLARETNVPAKPISSIVAGRRAITGETALRLGRYFGTMPEYWLNMQARFDLETARDEWEDRVKAEVATIRCMRRAVFFDRDGTLMEETGYCADPADVRVFPGAPEALRELKAAGFLNIVVSNQSGIGRGYFTELDYYAVQREFLRQIGEDLIAACYFCPDAPDRPTAWRKPEPGMLLHAAREFNIDLPYSVMIGDKASDIECARRAGTRAILVATGYGGSQSCEPDFRAPGIAEAADWILSNLLPTHLQDRRPRE